jgi:hypothetical protein
MSPNAGGGACGVSANMYSCTHGAQINFGDLAPYLTWQEESATAHQLKDDSELFSSEDLENALVNKI